MTLVEVAIALATSAQALSTSRLSLVTLDVTDPASGRLSMAAKQVDAAKLRSTGDGGRYEVHIRWGLLAGHATEPRFRSAFSCHNRTLQLLLLHRRSGIAHEIQSKST